ncbi:MAG TPA: hypothetical protein P5186_17670 [Candidatus Paceibacterota bacterium]|nr:hypothetical protein [Verrucomicrobiota bacterium]HRY49881.1 hypothetical protein [Candidatus Paceibacterota bacterium]
MKTPRLALCAMGSAAVIASGILIWEHHQLVRARAEIEQLRSETSALPVLREEIVRLQPVQVDQAELTRLREQMTAARRELPRLRAKAAEALRAEAETAQLRTELEQQAARGSETSQRMAAPMAELMQGGLEQMSRRQVARMEERLSLSPYQTQAIQEILTRKAQVMVEAAKGVLVGKLDQEKFASFRQGNRDSESQILALLSPEQLIAYAAFKEEERLTSAHLAANGELLQMQRTLALTEDQQERVFGVLYDQAYQQSQAVADDPEPANPAEAERRFIDRRLQALESVLTPTQLASYREHQELQLRFLERIASQMEPRNPQP